MPQEDSTTSDGARLVLVASSRPLPEPVFRFKEANPQLSRCSWRRRHYACGHRGPLQFQVNIFERESQWIKQRELCPECFLVEEQKRFIRCCLCGEGIAPGEPVALYCADSLELQHEHATLVGSSAVGCLGWDCCPSGAFFAGHWDGTGVRYAFSGEFEART